MKFLRLARLLLAVSSSVFALRAADKITLTVTHDLTLARPSETITIPWAQIAQAMPGVYLQHIAVKDATGRVLPYQVTNVAPEAKDPKNLGVAYGDLIFQHDFAAGEKSATFTVEKIEAVAPVFPSKVFARFVPERLDDFAWENDKIAHRTYGPALAAPDEPKRGKEVLITSGLDIWSKRVDYLIVDRWYNKGHDHYHHDEGEGMDMYNVGTSRGAGGTGVWDGQKLSVGMNYKTWKVIANGPVRAIFELTYDAWDVNGAKVSEVKRFTVDAGHNFDTVDSTFTVEGGAKDIVIGIGLNKDSSDKGQESKSEVTKNETSGWLAQWEVQKTNGSLGEAIIVPGAAFAGFAEDKVNQLVLAKATSGQPLRYYIGAGWSKAGDFKSKDEWNKYVADCAARATSPIKVTLAAAK
jgi:pectinesterase